MASLPYVTATGNVEKALLGIKAAATPESVTQDFVKTILKIPGGSGNQMAAFLKKIGFVKVDGSPSEIYTRFRNSSSMGDAAADALKVGYAPLSTRNEYWYALDDAKLRGLIIEETGEESNSATVGYILGSIKGLRKFATFDKKSNEPSKVEVNELPPALPAALPPNPNAQSVGLRLGYTINLNLPATADVAVFNAIFKSLKEHLLEGPSETE
ncbi:DUF5343 domain-containing protein [Bradyrhizobium sp. UFLA05-153]